MPAIAPLEHHLRLNLNKKVLVPIWHLFEYLTSIPPVSWELGDNTLNAESQESTFAYDVFISYSRKDIVFARALQKALENYSPPRDLIVSQHRLVIFRD